MTLYLLAFVTLNLLTDNFTKWSNTQTIRRQIAKRLKGPISDTKGNSGGS